MSYPLVAIMRRVIDSIPTRDILLNIIVLYIYIYIFGFYSVISISYFILIVSYAVLGLREICFLLFSLLS